MKECLLSLQALNIESNDSMTATIILLKLDYDTRMRFEESIINPKNILNLHELLTFIEKKFSTMESVNFSSSSSSNNNQIRVSNQHSFTDRNYNNKPTLKTFLCIFCNKNYHKINNCTEFKNKNHDAKIAFTTEKELCRNCLSHNFKTKCTSKYSCSICQKHHHTSLHNQVKNNTVLTSSFSSNSNNYIMLPTILLKATKTSGETIHIRALLDQASQARTYRSSDRLRLLS
jgi:hypothetical protein